MSGRVRDKAAYEDFLYRAPIGRSIDLALESPFDGLMFVPFIDDVIAHIQHRALRSLDRKAGQEQREMERHEKELVDYKVQVGRPFEHEARLKELLAKPAQLNGALDLDKHETQTAADTEEVPASFAAKVMVENRVAAMAP